MEVDSSKSVLISEPSEEHPAEVRFSDAEEDEEEEVTEGKSSGFHLAGGLDHTAVLRIDLENESASDMICRTLSVDKEPARSKAQRTLITEGKFLVAKFTSPDRRYLQKSIDNFLEMCDLAKQTLDRSMFKGLKSKLGDEAKWLQATVSHYSENLAQQVKSSAVGNLSDAGSEISGHAKRFFSPTVSDSSISLKNSDENIRVKSEIDSLEDTGNAEFGSRRRHNSTDSIGSNESTLSDLFSTIPGMVSSSRRLELLSSDVEGESIAGSAVYQNASKEQISSVLHKLQGRAATYKDKYRDLVKVYNELVRENEKYKSTLTSTQDKAIKRLNQMRSEKNGLLEKLEKLEKQLQKERENSGEAALPVDLAKMKKLEELLEKCKMSIGEYKEKNIQLTEENKKLKETVKGASDEQGISELAMQRINAEWKGKIEAVEAECSKKLEEAKDEATLLVAKVKAEMHATLEEKEGEVQAIRANYRQLESEGIKAQQQNNELQSTILALEAEKADMVEKLSQAKQQGVLAIRDEEERKRKNLEAALDKREEEFRARCQKQLSEEMKKLEVEWRRKFKEHEEQMQLAVEEREMQSAAAAAEQEKKIEELHSAVQQLTAEKLQLSLKLDSSKEKYEQELHELNERMSKNSEDHKVEIANLIKEHDELIGGVKKDLEDVKAARDGLKEELSNAQKNYEKNRLELEKVHQAVVTELSDEKKTAEKAAKHYDEELVKVKKELLEVSKARDNLLGRYKKSEALLEDLKREQVSDDEEISTLRQQLDEVTVNFNEQRQAMEKEINQLKEILQEKSAFIHQLESEKELISAKLYSEEDSQKTRDIYEQSSATKVGRDSGEGRVLLTCGEPYSLEENEEELIRIDEQVQESTPNQVTEKKKDFFSLGREGEEFERNSVEILKKKLSDLSTKLDNELAHKNALEEKVLGLKEELKNLSEENEKVSREKSDLELQLLPVVAELESKKNELENALGELQKHRSEVERNEELHSSLTEDLDVKEKEVEELKQQLKFANDQTNFLKESLAAKENDFRTLEKELTMKINELKTALSDRANEISATLAQKNNLGVIAEETRLKNEELQSKLATELQTVKSLQHEIALNKRDLEKANHLRDNFSREELAVKTFADAFFEKFTALSSVVMEKMDFLESQECRVRNLVAKVQSGSSLSSQLAFLKEKSLKFLELEEALKTLKESALQKEAVIEELQERIQKMTKTEQEKNFEMQSLEVSSTDLMKQVEVLQAEVQTAQKKCTLLQQELASANHTKQVLEERIKATEKLINDFTEKETEMRDHHETILNECEIRLTAAEKRLELFKKLQTRNEGLEADLADLKDQGQKAEKKLSEMLDEEKRSAESRIVELIRQKEAEVVNLKDDFAKEMAVLRGTMAEKINECESLRDALASCEKDLAERDKSNQTANSELRRELESFKNEKDSLTDKIKAVEHELRELRVVSAEKSTLLDSKLTEVAELQKNLASSEEEVKVLKDEKNHLVKKKEELEQGTKDLENHLEQLRNDSKTSAAKADNDRQRVVKEVQKEIKRLYEDLNDRSKKLDEANTTIAELTAKLSSAKTADLSSEFIGQSDTEICGYNDEDLHMDYEELQSLRNQVVQLQKEITILKTQQNSSPPKLEVVTEQNEGRGRHTPYFVNNDDVNDTLSLSLDDNARKAGKYSSDLSPNFADPAEAEYLRYVLYRYMSERETLGKESVTLAKVIATVAKFSREQLEIVVAKEEQRNNLLFRPIF
ncbi:unnamed protein product [Enterobius vermicularis]|uniref:L antigen family member 3 n=1 Tax=Enterobius vermicularis TaxID=51028 RepID=A0A0N4V7K7_ENTVE|nr:unnamed protein product [Enterobius vermicularis]